MRPDKPSGTDAGTFLPAGDADAVVSARVGLFTPGLVGHASIQGGDDDGDEDCGEDDDSDSDDYQYKCFWG